MNELFDPGFNLVRRFEDLFAILSGGKRVERPQSSEGRSFPPFTLRLLPEGQSIMVHNDYLFGLPLYAELSEQLDTRTLISFFVVLQAPAQGGGLVLFDLTQEDDVPRTAEGYPNQRMIEENYGSHEFAPVSGDMIVFPAGRFFHKVQTVRGPLPRVTLGGLLAWSRDAKRILYWG